MLCLLCSNWMFMIMSDFCPQKVQLMPLCFVFCCGNSYPGNLEQDSYFFASQHQLETWGSDMWGCRARKKTQVLLTPIGSSTMLTKGIRQTQPPTVHDPQDACDHHCNTPNLDRCTYLLHFWSIGTGTSTHCRVQLHRRCRRKRSRTGFPRFLFRTPSPPLPPSLFPPQFSSHNPSLPCRSRCWAASWAAPSPWRSPWWTLERLYGLSVQARNRWVNGGRPMGVRLLPLHSASWRA